MPFTFHGTDTPNNQHPHIDYSYSAAQNIQLSAENITSTNPTRMRSKLTNYPKLLSSVPGITLDAHLPHPEGSLQVTTRCGTRNPSFDPLRCQGESRGSIEIAKGLLSLGKDVFVDIHMSTC